MNVDIIFKIAGIGILVSVLSTVLKKDKEELSQMLTLAGVVLVLIMVIPLISQLFALVKNVFQFN